MLRAVLVVVLVSLIYIFAVVFYGMRCTERQHETFNNSRLNCVERIIRVNDVEITADGIDEVKNGEEDTSADNSTYDESGEKIENSGIEWYTLSNNLNMSIGDDFFFAADPESGRLLYYPDADGNDLAGEKLDDVGLKLDLNSGDTTRVRCRGRAYYATSRIVETDYYGRIALVSMNAVDLSTFLPFVLSSIVAFVFLAALTAFYVLQLKNEADEDNRKKLRLKSGLLIGGATLFVFVLSIYAAKIFDIESVNKMLYEADDFICGLTENRLKINLDDYMEIYDEKEEVANTLRTELEANGSKWFVPSESETFIYREDNGKGSIVPCPDVLVNPTRSVVRSPYLQSLAEKYGLNTLAVYDSNGRRIATTDGDWRDIISGRQTDNPDDDRSLEYSVLNRDYRSNMSQVDGQFVVARFINLYPYDWDGMTLFGSSKDDDVIEEFGLLEFTCDPPAYYDIVEDVYADVCSDSEELLLSKVALFEMEEDEEGEEKPVCRYSSSGLPTEKLSLLGLDDIQENFGGDYIGFSTVNGVRQLVSCRKITIDGGINGIKDMFVAYFTPFSVVNGSHTFSQWFIPFALLTAILLLAVTIIVPGITLNGTSESSEGSRIEISAYDDELLMFRQRSPDEKLLTVIKIAVNTAALLISIAFLFSIRNGDRHTVLHHIIYGNWLHGINLFSFTVFMLSVLCTAAIGAVLERLYDVSTRCLSAKICTMMRLIASIIKYACGLFCILFLLYLLGMDVKTVLTSLGAFSILIGLAAQSLIKDFISGFFVLMDGSYRIGDVVKIGNYTGKVREIGLRSTKFEDQEGNVTVINNSSITQLVNYSARRSNIRLEYTVPLGERLDRLEEVFEKEQASIEENLGDLLIGHIVYDGIVSTDINTKNCVIRFEAECQEKDRGELKHAIAKEIADIMKKYSLV